MVGFFFFPSSPPEEPQALRLYGYIGEMAEWFRNLTHLVKIYLEASQLKEDKTMEILGELPKLMVLQFCTRAYLGEKLVFRTGAFLNLRTLEIWETDHLKEIRFEDGTSRQIEGIEIGHCTLKSGIIDVKHLPELKVISLSSGCKVARLSMLEEELNAHPNHPVLRLEEERSYHNLGDVEGSNVEVEATESVPENAGEISQVVTPTTTDSEIQPASS